MIEFIDLDVANQSNLNANKEIIENQINERIELLKKKLEDHVKYLNQQFQTIKEKIEKYLKFYLLVN